jgi:hypothetical protein
LSGFCPGSHDAALSARCIGTTVGGVAPKVTPERLTEYKRTCPPGQSLKEHATALGVSPTWISRHGDWKHWGASGKTATT